MPLMLILRPGTTAILIRWAEVVSSEATGARDAACRFICRRFSFARCLVAFRPFIGGSHADSGIDCRFGAAWTGATLALNLEAIPDAQQDRALNIVWRWAWRQIQLQPHRARHRLPAIRIRFWQRALPCPMHFSPLATSASGAVSAGSFGTLTSRSGAEIWSASSAPTAPANPPSSRRRLS